MLLRGGKGIITTSIHRHGISNSNRVIISKLSQFPVQSRALYPSWTSKPWLSHHHNVWYNRSLVMIGRCVCNNGRNWSKSGHGNRSGIILAAKRTFATRQSQSQSSSSSLPPFWMNMTLTLRILAAFSTISVLTTYVFEITKCEGPSMKPTINSRGDIILVERVTHRLYGLESTGVLKGNERKALARKCQEQWEKKEQKRHSLLVHQQKIRSSNITKNITIQSDTCTDTGSISNDNDENNTAPNIIPPTWYQPKQPPVNELSSLPTFLQKWQRFYTHLSTGIHVGDVVVLQHPHKEGTVCKRVLGLPGDIVLRPSEYDRNTGRFLGLTSRENEEDQHRQIKNLFEDTIVSDDDEIDKENDQDSSASLSLLSTSGINITNSSLVIVPDGHLWVEGDNSVESSDSRFYGPVSSALLVGKVLMRIWPLNRRSRNCNEPFIERGGRPMPSDRHPFTGSTVLPAGYEGENIVSTHLSK